METCINIQRASCLALCSPALHFTRQSLVQHFVCNPEASKPAKALTPQPPHLHTFLHTVPSTTTTEYPKPHINFKTPNLTRNRKRMSKSQRDADLYSQLAAKDTQPEPLKKVLAREQANYDCLSCRVMGEFSSFSCCTHPISSLCLLALPSDLLIR